MPGPRILFKPFKERMAFLFLQPFPQSVGTLPQITFKVRISIEIVFEVNGDVRVGEDVPHGRDHAPANIKIP